MHRALNFRISRIKASCFIFLLCPLLGRADCPGDTCANERRMSYSEEASCQAIRSPSAKNACWGSQAYKTASLKYQSCMRMCNERGHLQTIEKKQAGLRPRPLPDGIGPSVRTAPTQTPGSKADFERERQEMLREKSESNRK